VRRATVALPDAIPERLENGKGTDWNDVHAAKGLESVRAGIEAALLARGPTPPDGESPPLSAYADDPQACVHEAEAVPEGTSEEELALLFSERHADELRYVALWGRWLKWDGMRWKHEDTLEVFDLARKLCREVRAALGEVSEKTHNRLGSAATRAALEKLARSDRRHAVRVDQLDAHPWLLNTPGGTLDLRTGELNLTTATSCTPRSRPRLC
jgi:hypothetical protein